MMGIVNRNTNDVGTFNGIDWECVTQPMDGLPPRSVSLCVGYGYITLPFPPTPAPRQPGEMTAESQAQGAASSCSWEADLEGLLVRITGYLDEGGSGYDSLGRDYTELRELWEAMGLLPRAEGEEDEDGLEEEAQQQQHEEQQRQQRQGQQPWYSQAFDYWEEEGNCPATEDGVLGGFGHVSPRDIAGSRAFVDKLRAALPTLKLGRVVGAFLRWRMAA